MDLCCAEYHRRVAMSERQRCVGYTRKAGKRKDRGGTKAGCQSWELTKQLPDGLQSPEHKLYNTL